MNSSSLNKNVEVAAIVILLCILLPFLIVCFYCHPHSDDFMMAEFYNKNGFWNSQAKWYNGWTGRFVSVALQGIFNPLRFNFYFGFKLFPFFTLLAFCASIYYLLINVFKNFIGKRSIALLALIFCSYFFIFLPGLSDGVYWFTANLGYFVPMVFFPPFLVFLYRIYKGVGDATDKLLFLLLGFLMIGSNELALVQANSSLFLAIIYQYITTKRVNKFLIGAFIFFLVASFISILAPGNFHRSSYEGGPNKQNLFYTFYSALALGTNHLFNILFKTPLLFVMMLFFSITKKEVPIAQSSKLSLIWFGIFAAFVLGVYLVTLTPGTFAGLGNYSRTLNVSLFGLLVGLCLITFFASVYLIPVTKKIRNRRWVNYMFLGSLLFFLATVLISDNNLKTVVNDWRSGKLQEYNAQVKKRMSLLEQSKGLSKLELEKLTAIPSSIVDEHGKDVDINIRNYQEYFKIDSIQLKP